MSKNSKSITALKAYISSDNKNTDEIFDGLEGETDRAAIIIASAFVEDSLWNVLDAHSRSGMSKAQENEIWGSQGVIGTFSAKIKVAYAFGWIDERTKRQLNILREMRNACAHAQMPVTFKTKELADVCDQFLKNSIKPVDAALVSSEHGVRRAFQNECVRIATTFLSQSIRTLKLKGNGQHYPPMNALALPYKSALEASPEGLQSDQKGEE